MDIDKMTTIGNKKESDEPAYSAPPDWGELLPGLSKAYYEGCEDWEGRKEHLVGMLKHYWHGQTHHFENDVYEVQVLFRPLTVRLVNVRDSATSLMAVERMMYMLEDLGQDDNNIDVRTSFAGAVLIQPSLRFETYYYERMPSHGSTPSDELGPLSPKASSDVSYGIPLSAVEVV
jgi:hypothetical protein